jgi:glycine/D-amino acid oxidase-like deaminating enzyme
VVHLLHSISPSLLLVLLFPNSSFTGGHTKGASYRSFLDNVKAIGEEDAIKIAQLEYNCMVAVHDFIAKHNIPCDARRLQTVDIFDDQVQLDKAYESVALMQKLMPESPAAKYTFRDPSETSSKFYCSNILGSVSYEAGSLSAYALTIGTLKLALKKGLNLQTNTPATSISKSSSGWAISTPRGTITAPTLILATNGYTAHLHTQLLGVIVPFRGHITTQRPGLSLPDAGSLPTTYSFIHAAGAYEYMITRPHGTPDAGAMLIGGGLTHAHLDGLHEYGTTDDTSLNPDITEYLTDCTAHFFGKNWGEDNPEGRIKRVHSGIMGYSADGYPLVGEMPGEGNEGLFIDASFQGHGMVLCFLCARAVAEMVLGRGRGEELEKWFPEVFRVSERRLRGVFKGRGGRTEVDQKQKENAV